MAAQIKRKLLRYFTLFSCTSQKLSWRDVQHIIIRSSTADSKILKATDWITNGANLTGSLYLH